MKTLIHGLLMLGMVASWPQAGISQRLEPQETQQVEQYLRSLGLDRLVIEQLEFEAASEIDLAVRRELVARLLNQYADRMLASQTSDEKLQVKAEQLIATYPELASTSVRMAILQSRYLRGEQAFQDWWNTGRLSQAHDELAKDWHELKNELNTLNQQLESQYQDQVAVMQSVPENREFETRQLVRIEGQLLHTNYLIGWSAYFLGVLNPVNARKNMQLADDSFRSFLQIEPQTILTEVGPKWFDFTSDWNARALVGLAMSERGLNRIDQSQYCFELIQNHATRQTTRDLRYVWDLNCRLYQNEFSAGLELVELVERATRQSSQISEAGRIAFWLATLRASIAIKVQSPPSAQRLMRKGMTGLTLEFQAPVIRKFLQENNFELTDDDFISKWIRGYLYLDSAESSQQEEAYANAKTELLRALEHADRTTDPVSIVHCRFLLAKVGFHEAQYEWAAGEFLGVADAVNDLNPQFSAESLWLAIRALSELSRTQPRNQVRTLRAIDRLLRRFPGSSYASRAEFEKLRINLANLPPDEAIHRLQRIDTNDTNYPLALDETIKLRYQAWRDAFESGAEAAPQELAELKKTELRFRKLSLASDGAKLRALLLVVDALLRDPEAGLDEARERLAIAKVLAESSLGDGALVNEYRYFEFRYAVASDNTNAAIETANWLVENARGSQFEYSALVRLAQTLDQRMSETDAPVDADVVEAIRVFERLVELQGASDEQLVESINARVAYARLAELKNIAGQRKESIQMLEKLNRVFPTQKTYVHQLAVALTADKQYSQAIPIWRKISASVDPGSDDWFESKYFLADCLFQTGDIAAAQQLCRQTIRLSSEIPEPWKTRFAELSKRALN